MRLGVHVSSSGKISESLARAKELGCQTMQIFARNPQRWRDSALDAQDIKEFYLLRRQMQAEIDPVFIHISYLINLASPDPKLYRGSIAAYVQDIKEARELGADFIVTHMGSHKDTSEEEGIKRLVRALNMIIEQTRDSAVGILLENTSGSGSWLGYKFSHHKKIIAGIKDKKRIGLCVDTAHAYLAGYNIAAKNGLEAFLSEIDKNVGLESLRLIHLNDAKGTLGSRQDRHAHIGKGNIGLEGISRIVNHPKLKHLPFILETPKEEDGDDARNLKAVRQMVKK